MNYLETRKREHSRKPDELYPIIEACSPGPYAELFARGRREGWTSWGNQADGYAPTWPTYAHNSAALSNEESWEAMKRELARLFPTLQAPVVPELAAPE